MDLFDVVAAVAKPEPPPPTASSEEKAQAFYDLMSENLVRHRGQTKSAIRNGYLRASSMAKALAMLPALRAADKVEKFEAAFMSDERDAGAIATLDAGHTIHDRWQQVHLAEWGLLWGDWRCVKCEKQFVGTAPDTCDCGSKRFDFEERMVKDDVLRYSGHADGLLLLPGDKEWPRTLLELKSISSAGWDMLAAPQEDHMVQIHAYMRRAQDTFALPAPVKETMMVYIDKGKQARWRRNDDGSFTCVSPPRWKVYHVDFDGDRWGTIEAGLKEFWAIRDGLAA